MHRHLVFCLAISWPFVLVFLVLVRLLALNTGHFGDDHFDTVVMFCFAPLPVLFWCYVNRLPDTWDAGKQLVVAGLSTVGTSLVTTFSAIVLFVWGLFRLGVWGG